MYISCSFYLGLMLFFLNYGLQHCLRTMKLIPGIPTVIYYDKQYIENILFQTRRYGRKSDYVVNIEYTSKHTWTNDNISLHYVFYEYLHNEYRRSFIEVHSKLCDLILKDNFIGIIARKAGLTTCPILSGRHHMMNMTFNYEFPSVWPFEKGKCELTIKMEPTGKMIIIGDLGITFLMKET